VQICAPFAISVHNFGVGQTKPIADFLPAKV
jgi:hypothetical protein